MLSRVAESIYWMSRQVERAENLARFLEVTHNLILDQPENLVDVWEPLVQVTADNEIFQQRYGEPTAETVTQFLAFDAEYSNSMLSSLRDARENARGVRESLSSEAFEQFNDFYHFVFEAAQKPVLESPTEFFDAVRRIAIQWTGVLDSTMPRDLGWHFANVGRLIERADKTSRILDVKYFNLLPRVDDVGTAIDDLQWSALLLAISGFEAYRRKHHLISIDKVVEFFLFNESFPRSILFCVTGAEDSLNKICKISGPDSGVLAKQRTSALCHRLGATQVQEVLAGGMHQFVDSIQIQLNQIGDAMNEDYFHAKIDG
ncbi:MAG: alpha-E domain-containing protein [Planctomycetota bacterium]|nr:alpha-E domain-containing protein [Planctomycetota bacterium]